MSIHPDSLLRFSPQKRLQWEEVQQRYVILYPEGMVELNQSSAEILKLCDGTHTLNSLITELETKFSTTGLGHDITTFIEVALRNGWIEHD